MEIWGARLEARNAFRAESSPHKFQKGASPVASPRVAAAGLSRVAGWVGGFFGGERAKTTGKTWTKTTGKTWTKTTGKTIFRHTHTHTHEFGERGKTTGKTTWKTWGKTTWKTYRAVAYYFKPNCCADDGPRGAGCAAAHSWVFFLKASRWPLFQQTLVLGVQRVPFRVQGTIFSVARRLPST